MQSHSTSGTIPLEPKRWRRIIVQSISRLFHDVRSRPKKPSIPIADPDFRPLRLTCGRRSAQTQSRLLNLPAEIRLIIWNCMLAQHPILLYHKDRKATCDLLVVGEPLRLERFTQGIASRGYSVHKGPRPWKSDKMRLLALLQTCRTM